MDIEGTLPQELVGGALFRAGPGNFERGGRRYNHVLDGDGYVQRFSFGEGKIAVKGRFVRTQWYVEEEAANEILYRNTFGSQPSNVFSNFFDLELKNVANTNAQYWGGRLLSLWEAGMPHELDPHNLETKGSESLGGFSNLGPDGR